jgi:excisionase family DNA binding protein
VLSTTHSTASILADNGGDFPRPSSPRPETLLTAKDVAELLRVPVSWVYDRARSRSLDRLPAVRLGKYWRFREQDIVAWLRHQQS